MGRSPAVHAFGNINYNKTFIRGIVIEKFDSRKPGARCAQWSLRVKFYPPSHPEGKVYEILRQHCKYGEIPSGANPQQNDIYPSRSLDISDPVIRGSTTYVQNAMGTADNSSTAGGGTGSNTDALMCQVRQMLCRQQIIMVAEALLIKGTPQRLLQHHYHQFLMLLLAWAPLLLRRRPTLQLMLSRLHRQPLAPPPPLRSNQQHSSSDVFYRIQQTQPTDRPFECEN
jgi:hypothetical protein